MKDLSKTLIRLMARKPLTTGLAIAMMMTPLVGLFIFSLLHFGPVVRGILIAGIVISFLGYFASMFYKEWKNVKSHL